MILAHYYRAMVGRADVWRTRMDATANWTIGATAAVTTFALGNTGVPHYVVFTAALMTTSFLLLEARRLTFYHLWQSRVLLLEAGLVRPALRAADSNAASALRPPEPIDVVPDLDEQLGHTVPTMPLSKAVARRLRRIYLYLYAVQWIAWALKLAIHPHTVREPAEWVSRAAIAGVPGAGVLALTALLFAGGVGLALVRGGIDRQATT